MFEYLSKRTVLIAVSLFTLTAVFSLPSQSTENPEKPASQKPKTCHEAVDLIINNLDDNSRELLLSIEKEELKSRRFITGWGKGIRDGFGLTEGNFELMESCQTLREDAVFHPVNISGIIMEEVWEKIRK